MTASLTSAGNTVRRVKLTARTLAAGLVASVVLLQIVLASTNLAGRFPERWNWQLHEPIDAVQRWVRNNQLTHPLFTWFFTV